MRIALILNGFSLGIKKDVLSINDKVLNSRKKSLKKLLIYEYIGIKINFYVKKKPQKQLTTREMSISLNGKYTFNILIFIFS